MFKINVGFTYAIMIWEIGNISVLILHLISFSLYLHIAQRKKKRNKVFVHYQMQSPFGDLVTRITMPNSQEWSILKGNSNLIK